MRTPKCIRVYVDSNALINFFTQQKNEKDAFKYLFEKRRREVLFTSTLAIAQTISNLQTKKKTRAKFSKEQTNQIVDFIKTKFTILEFSKTDIENARNNNKSEDFEDCIHYEISQKKNCDCIITNNIKDFTNFQLPVLQPSVCILKDFIK
ncbi:MAG: type II toxin-antitoxin system VapC family toxin [Bacteroidales bacterium]|nr:type II toxin-antitoxin system VapC family toxin [Bacteroidales bacterium]MCQ2605467.1 type II toxin-antitoxin system VapC family toxin [Bacteroidales bacterium]